MSDQKHFPRSVPSDTDDDYDTDYDTDTAYELDDSTRVSFMIVGIIQGCLDWVSLFLLSTFVVDAFGVRIVVFLENR
jgi:hypothetical protein